MKSLIPIALTVVLTITFASCSKPNNSDNQAPDPVMEDSTFKEPVDSSEVFSHFSYIYYEGNARESLCANNKQQYLLYKGKSNLAKDFADYYNALLMFHNMYSDEETAKRFSDSENSVNLRMADSIMRLDCSIIRNDTLRRLVKSLRKCKADKVQHPDQENDTADKASEEFFGFLSEKLNPIIESSNDIYQAYMDRKGIYDNFYSVMSKRGKSSKAYKRELIAKMRSADTPVKRHVYAIEYAHSDSACAHFLIGAVVLDNEFARGEYSPYLYGMWRTWRASASTMIGKSSWAYIPNLLYNQKRKQVADIILRHIENNPTDTFAQGLLINIAGCENISRHGSLFGNASISEQMSHFPEWENGSNH